MILSEQIKVVLWTLPYTTNTVYRLLFLEEEEDVKTANAIPSDEYLEIHSKIFVATWFLRYSNQYKKSQWYRNLCSD